MKLSREKVFDLLGLEDPAPWQYDCQSLVERAHDLCIEKGLSTDDAERTSIRAEDEYRDRCCQIHEEEFLELASEWFSHVGLTLEYDKWDKKFTVEPIENETWRSVLRKLGKIAAKFGESPSDGEMERCETDQRCVEHYLKYIMHSVANVTPFNDMGKRFEEAVYNQDPEQEILDNILYYAD